MYNFDHMLGRLVAASMPVGETSAQSAIFRKRCQAQSSRRAEGSATLSPAATPAHRDKTRPFNRCFTSPARLINMSRFFHGSDSSSESSSDEEELYSEEEEEKSEQESSEEESSEEEEGSDEDSSDEEGGKSGASRFLREASDESGSEDEERVTIVKSAKDKRFDELEGIIRLIENAQKISDWGVINDSTYTCERRDFGTISADNMQTSTR